MKETVAIIGLGMLGCSLGASLNRSGYRRIGWARRPEIGPWAEEHQVIDAFVPDVEDALRQADIAVLCLPIPTIREFLKRYAASMKQTLVTDIGSVKGCIVKTAQEQKVRFIGGHPMAGTEFSGPEAMVPGIYEKATVFIVPPRGASDADIEAVARMWQAVQAKPMILTPKAHDQLVAHTSHVPHVVSSALALSVLDTRGELKKRRFAGCASGFRDTIRVAASSPKMWREIFSHNKEALLEAMATYEVRYARMKEMIASGDFDAFEKEFAKGRDLVEEWRSGFRKDPPC